MDGNSCFVFCETAKRQRRRETAVNAAFFRFHTAAAEGGTKMVVRLALFQT